MVQNKGYKRGKGSGWFGEPERHSKARRGIRSVARGVRSSCVKDFFLSNDVLDKIGELNREAGRREWIGEFDLLGGEVVLNDVQFGDDVASYMNWDYGVDCKRNVGYIHYHPKHLFPLFTAQDFVLGCLVHKTRKNHGEFKGTLMGLVTPFRIVVLSLKPKVGRMKVFESYVAIDGLPSTRDNLKKLVGDMLGSGEVEVLVDHTFDKSKGIDRELVI